MDILNNLIERSDISTKEKSELKNICEICAKQNYFQFENKFFKQRDGLPMGSPISPLLAEIFLANFESLIFTNNNYTKHVIYWARYVDDVFCIWNSTHRNLNQFFTFLNSLNEKIQFTMELENNNEINFLDINIKKINNELKFNIYRKPTTTDTVIHKNSQQSWKIKMSAFHSLTHRLLNFPLNEEDYKNELSIIKQIAHNNGYNASLIDNMIKNKQNKIIKKLFYSVPNEKPKNYRFLNHIPKCSDRVSKKLNKLGCNTVTVNKQNIGKILVNNKTKIDKLNKSGVYKINCEDCAAVYIGQTGRNINTRVKEHINSIRYNKKNTGISTHCIDNNHFIDLNNIKLVHNEKKSKRLDLLEQFEIKKSLKNNEFITNDQQNFMNTPILDIFLK